MDRRPSFFFALVPAGAAHEACRIAAWDLLRRTTPDGPVTPPENYHMTLLYLGEGLDDTDFAIARQEAALIRVPPFAITLDHAGSFTKAGVWWLGCRDVPEALSALRVELVRRIAPKVSSSRPGQFTPHVTVARSPLKLPPTMIRTVDWPVGDFCLVRGVTGPIGAPTRYEVIERWPLAGQRLFHEQQMPLL